MKKQTQSEIEDFPSCEGCIYYVNYECTDDPEDLMGCYRGDNFVNRALKRWWKRNIRVQTKEREIRV